MSLENKSLVLIGVVVIIVAAIYFAKDAIMQWWTSIQPNKNAPAANQTGTTPTGQLITGSDVKYVNPMLCALTGQFCDPNAVNSTTSTKLTNGVYDKTVATQYNQYGQPTDNPLHELNNDGSAANMSYAQTLVNRLNAGQTFTQYEVDWAKTYEPSLYQMIKNSVAQQPTNSNSNISATG